MATLKQAIALGREGHNNKACDILRDMVVTNKHDIYAWLWLAEYSPNPDEARHAAYQVLSLRPTNQRARKLLEQMGQVAVPPQYLSQHSNKIGKSKRAFVRSRLSNDRWNARFLVILILLLIASGIFLIVGIIASGNDNRTAQNEDVSLQSLFISSQQNTSENVTNDDTKTQQVVETLGGAALEHSIKIFAHSIQVDFVFDLLKVIDSTANFDMDDQISLTIADQTIESPAYEDMIGSIYVVGNGFMSKFAML